jgi:C4-dicarboxylate transporter DctM subunit
MIILITLLIVILLLLVGGIHIGAALGLSAAFLLLVFESMPISTIAQNAFVSVNSYPLAAIPFFILTGDIALEGKLADRLLDFVGLFLRKIQAGLAMAVVASTVFFAAVSGSSVASAAALGRSVIELLKDEDYPQRFIAGLVAAGSTMGLLIPPSLTFIIIGSMYGIPIIKLFTAGIIPGLSEAMLTMGLCYFLCKKNGWGKPENAKNYLALKNRYEKIGNSFFPLLKSSAGVLFLPFLILGGIYLGFFTPTEVAAVAAGYAALLALLIHRSMKIRGLITVLGRTLKQSAMIYFVIIGGNMIGFMLVSLGITDILTEAVISAGISKYQFLLIINIILLIMGCFLDGISVVVLTVPILFPIAESLGINPIHFAVIITCNVEVATLTPPVGLNIYVMSGVTGLSIDKVVRGVGPFYVLQVFLLFLITYVPTFSLFLVDIL